MNPGIVLAVCSIILVLTIVAAIRLLDVSDRVDSDRETWEGHAYDALRVADIDGKDGAA